MLQWVVIIMYFPADNFLPSLKALLRKKKKSANYIHFYKKKMHPTLKCNTRVIIH